MDGGTAEKSDGNKASGNLEHHRQQGTANSSQRSLWDRLKFSRDHRATLPPYLQRFTGYRNPGEKLPFEPLPFPPFSWLKKIPMQYEVWIFAWLGAFVSILLIEAIMSASTAFQTVYHSPIIITSFGASAVLTFGVLDAPVAQPRNLVGGHFVSAFMGTWITRLFVLNPTYDGNIENTNFHANTFVNGGISMASSLLAMLVTGTVHPPAGATGLNAAVQPEVVMLSWHYLPVVLASSLVMLGWAVIWNNLGRRRYPTHWWAAGVTFVRQESAQSQAME